MSEYEWGLEEIEGFGYELVKRGQIMKEGCGGEFSINLVVRMSVCFASDEEDGEAGE